MRGLSIGLLAALAIVTGAAASERVPADSAATRQKAAFVENLVTESVSARRIENSGDAAAIDALERARELVERAQSDLAARNTAAADAKLGEALSLVNSEVRRISGGEVRDAHDRRMYERRLSAVETFLAAYERVAESRRRLCRGHGHTRRGLRRCAGRHPRDARGPDAHTDPELRYGRGSL